MNEPNKTENYLNHSSTKRFYETQFTTLEEKRPDALEMAAQAHEKREAATRREIIN